MNQTTYLDGKIRKQSLPVFNNTPGPKDKGPKRLFLAQGELANFYDGDEGIRYIAFIEFRLGKIRGNHVHQVKEEQVYILSGEIELIAQMDAPNTRTSIQLHAGDLVVISTGVAHAFRAIQAGSAVEFSTAKFDLSDVQSFKLI